jgi:enamine deaminase RidA (YjgF/YER057c/UK114 family)
MPKRAIIPPKVQTPATALGMSSGIISGDHFFLTGTTGSGPDRQKPQDAGTQFRLALEKIGYVLRHAGKNLDAVVEMTTYHIGLRAHFDLFDKVRHEVFTPPYPA